MSDTPKDDDWAMTDPNLKFDPQTSPTPTGNNPSATDESTDIWSVQPVRDSSPAPSARNDEWQMPEPTFRVSEGVTPTFEKSSPPDGFNAAPIPEIEFDTDPSLDFANANATAIPAAPAQPEPAVAAEPTAAPKAKKSGGSGKWILMLVGLGGVFSLVLVSIVAAYMILSKPSASVAEVPSETPSEKNFSANKPVPAAAAPSPAALPSKVIFKGEMVLVEAGEFTMGSDTLEDESKPAHQVTLAAFYIDRTEVTNAQYGEFCKATGTKPPADPFWEPGYFEKRPRAPVIGVTFVDAKAFAKWAGKRLPTEQEWEKAASWNATTKTKFVYPWGNDYESGRAAFGIETPKDVGSIQSAASPSGALDMSGNVAEWVDAFFEPYPGNTFANPNYGETNRVVRGGFFAARSNDLLKTTRRIYVPPNVASGEDEEKLFAAAIGFRCAISADDPQLAETLRSSQGK